jgi:hypothetical protein
MPKSKLTGQYCYSYPYYFARQAEVWLVYLLTDKAAGFAVHQDLIKSTP